MNVFLKTAVAETYDDYYLTDFGKQVDNLEQKLVSELISNIPRGPMLELGCGTGHWTDFFIREGFQLTGVDISEPMLQIARSKSIKADFIQADVLDLPFAEESYNLISAITMLEFVSDQEQALESIYRTLKPGGWFIAGCLNAESVLGKNKAQDETFRHGSFFTSKELQVKLQRFGRPSFNFGVHLNENSELLDGTTESEQVQPVFLAAIVQKNK